MSVDAAGGAARGLTHAEINRRFRMLDQSRDMLQTRFDGWLAWPAVKERMWLLCLRSGAPGEAHRGGVGDSLVRVAGGLAALLRLLVDCSGPRVSALLYEVRDVALPCGDTVHPHLGRLGATCGGNFHYVYDWSREARRQRPWLVQDREVGAVCALIARLVRRDRRVRRVVQCLAAGIANAFPELDATAIDAALADQLARFAVRRRLFTWLFRRLRVARVVVLDPDAKSAEVAAGKGLGLPVVEVQHGIFSTRDPDYSWDARHHALDIPMPIPDRVIVFGERWRRLLAAGGYWPREAIILASSPALAAARARREQAVPPDGGPLRVLFATQDHVRAHALTFLREVLAHWRHSGVRATRLWIKVHPRETQSGTPYAALAQVYPDLCAVVPPETDGLHALAMADVVVSYSSLMLMEALAVGLPVIAIRGGVVGEGFVETFDLQDLRAGIVEVATRDEFDQAVRRACDPGTRARWLTDVERIAEDVFSRSAPAVETVIAHA